MKDKELDSSINYPGCPAKHLGFPNANGYDNSNRASDGSDRVQSS